MKNLLVVTGVSERDILKRIPLDEVDSVQSLEKLGLLLLNHAKTESYCEEISNGIVHLSANKGATMIVTTVGKTYLVPFGAPYAIMFE